LQPNVLVEPCRRNTAPAIALAAQHLLETSPDGENTVLAILPADHAVEDSESFRATLRQAEGLAKQGYIATLGITPTEAHTGYGYIQVAQAAMNKESAQQGWFPVEAFVEKPDAKTAQRYFEANNYFWNAGIFVLTIKTLMDALQTHAPKVYEPLKQGYDYAFQRFDSMPDISFDYAVMEHAKKVAVLPLNTVWSDVGSWDSLYHLLPKTESNNAIKARNTEFLELVETEGCLLWSETQRPIALLGLSNCMVVDTPDALLVASLSATQQVRTVVEALERANHSSINQPSQHHLAWGQSTLANLQAMQQHQAKPVVNLEINPYARLELTVDESSTLHVLAGELNEADTTVNLLTLEPETAYTLSSGAYGAHLLVVGAQPKVHALPALHQFKSATKVAASKAVAL
jgi:mannose-1-phosphate guanylyltransferase / mannose-6-phosphate isomerase